MSDKVFSEYITHKVYMSHPEVDHGSRPVTVVAVAMGTDGIFSPLAHTTDLPPIMEWLDLTEICFHETVLILAFH